MFLDMEKFYDSGCLYRLADHAMARDFPRRLLYIATQAYLSVRILRARDMVGQSIQPSNGILAGCSLGNRFARVMLYEIFDSVNNVLPAQLPAPVETRQFVDDVTTMSVASYEDDVTRSICSVALELRHELEASKLTLNKNKSMIVGKAWRNECSESSESTAFTFQWQTQRGTWASMQQVGPGDDAVREI